MTDAGAELIAYVWGTLAWTPSDRRDVIMTSVREYVAAVEKEAGALDPRRLTDAINAVWKRHPGLEYAGFVYGETGAEVAREYEATRKDGK